MAIQQNPVTDRVPAAMPSSVAELRPGRSPAPDRPVVLLLPPVGGSPAVYAQLLPILDDDVQVIGAQSVGLLADGDPDTTVPAMAQRYATDVTEFAKMDACLLIGYSMGGVVAVETARILRDRGVPRIDVLLVDSEPVDEVPADASPFSALLGETLGIEVDLTAEDGAETADLLLRIRDAAVEKGRLPRRFPVSRLERMATICAVNQAAASDFTPARYPGVLHSLRPVAPGAPADRPGETWLAHADDVVTEYVEADHFNILGPPAVRRVAATANDLLRRPAAGR